MTSPYTAAPTAPQPQSQAGPASPWTAIGAQQEQDAMTSITRMLTGTSMLKDEPGVVYALAAQQAHPEDAQAIDQFMQGLDAEKQVRVAQAAGSKIVLSPQQQGQLDTLGVDYSGVLFTQQDALNDTVAHLTASGQTVQRDAQGNPVVDAQGNLQVQAPKYKAKGIGRLFQTLNNDVIKPVNRDVVQPVGTVLNKGYNMVSTLASQNGYGMHPLGSSEWAASVNARSTDMQNLGYDPNNIWSVFAYQSSGKAHSNLAPLSNKWDSENPSGLFGLNGDAAVAEATKFLNGPKTYRQQIENDPTLTPTEVAQKLQMLSSPQFSSLAKEVSGRSANVGDDFARQVGLDPVAHPLGFALTSAGVNLAAAFMIDPLLIAGKVANVAKLSSVGIDTLADSEKAASILDPARSSGLFAGNVQRGWTNLIDYGAQIRQADAEGDTVKVAALTARANAELPGIAPLLPDVIGSSMVTGYTEKTVAGVKTVEPVMGQGEGIHNLADAAEYVASKDALLRLMNGRAATQSSLMPGALSAVGYRTLKGLTAEWMTTRSARRAQNADAVVTDAAKADPALAQKLIDEGDLLKIQPQADDAVSAINDQVLADKQLLDHWNSERMAALGSGVQEDITQTTIAAQRAETQLQQSTAQLASAQRSQDAGFALTPQGKGNVAFNVRASGHPLGGAPVGWAGPTAVAARARLAAQRFTTMLPRNTLIDINDSASGDKIYKLAMTCLNRGDARGLQAAWNVGDGGQRKSIIGGLIDQLGHAAGLGKSESGQKVLDLAKTKVESYSSVGDEATLDGQNLALHAGQVRTKWLLPSFRDLQRGSSKLGLWEATMGRAATSSQADTLMTQWKMGALFKPSTVTRNQLEGWGRTTLEGQLGAALKSRAMLTMPNKELWARGYAQDAKTEYDSLIADGKLKEAKELSLSNMLGGDILGRSKVTQKLAEFAPFALAGRAYRTLYGRAMNENDFKALESMGPDELAAAMEGYGQQIMESDLGFKGAATHSTEIAKAGYGPSTMRMAIARAKDKGTTPAEGQSVSWTQHDADGTVGADRFANALAQRVNATPTVARSVMDVLEKPETYDVNHVVKALDDPAIAKEMHLTGYGSLYWDDANTAARRALTPDEVSLGKQDFANKVINDYRYLLTGQNGEYQSVLAKEIRQTGKAPDSDWIAGKLTNQNRPQGVLAPEVMAMPNGGIKSVATMLQDIEGGAYQWMVERPLQRTTSSPVFWANYTKARTGLNPIVEKLVNEQGISREAAENFAKEVATRNAWVKTEQLIDDPGQKSQFDIVARNLFPFSRATQAMVRRWGTGLWQDPARARKMMLAYEGGVQSGLIYTNAYGEPTFTYPGSGVMNMLMREVAKIPGLENLSQFPVASTMTGGVLMAVPGADNPFRMSMGPMMSIPMREIFKLFPDHRSMLDQVDSFINGPIGVGQTFSQLEPTLAKRFYTAMDENSRNSALASSTVGAIANLAAGGQVPPAGASPSERDAFIQNLKTQVRSQLFLRAVFGLFAPAAPSAPTDSTTASQADYAFQVDGIKSLSDEYKKMLDETGGNLARTNAIWNALHPDKTVYEVAHTAATSSKASLPATDASLNWMASNAGFISKYKDVSAYFLPAGDANAPFNDQAYQTQLELGLRQKDTPTEFYDNVRVRGAEDVYYPTVANFDAQIAAAKTAGDTASVTQLTANKSQWETDFKNLNPLFGAKLDQYGPARALAVGQLADLHNMVNANAVPDGLGGLLNSLLQAYDGYTAFTQSHTGSDAQSTDARSQALGMFNDWAKTNIAGTPLQSLYQAVFRVLNTNLVTLAPPAPTS